MVAQCRWLEARSLLQIMWNITGIGGTHGMVAPYSFVNSMSSRGVLDLLLLFRTTTRSDLRCFTLILIVTCVHYRVVLKNVCFVPVVGLLSASVLVGDEVIEYTPSRRIQV